MSSPTIDLRNEHHGYSDHESVKCFVFDTIQPSSARTVTNVYRCCHKPWFLTPLYPATVYQGLSRAKNLFQNIWGFGKILA